MKEGIFEFNLAKLFSYGYYQYGFPYFFLIECLSLPFLITQHFSPVIWIARMVSSVSFVGSLTVILLIFNSKKDSYSTLIKWILLGFILMIPICWEFATAFRPDWPMIFFLVLTLYYLKQDNQSMGKSYIKAVLSFSAALIVKFQAITFFPLILVYPILPLNFRGLKHSLWAFLSSIGMFILFNPYLLHPTGRYGFLNRLTQEFSKSTAPIGFDIKLMILQEKFIHGSIIISLFLFLCLFPLFKSIVSDKFRFTFFLTMVLNCLYYFWIHSIPQAHHFLPLVILLLVLASEFLLDIKVRHNFVLAVLCGLVSVHVFFSCPGLYQNFSKILVITPQNKQILDSGKHITKALAGKMTKDDTLLLNLSVPADPKSLGVSLSQFVYTKEIYKHHLNQDAFLKRYNNVNPRIKPFREKTFFLWNKASLNHPSNSFHTQEVAKMRASIGYQTLYEDELFWILEKR